MSNYFIILIINLFSMFVTIFLTFKLINVKKQLSTFNTKLAENYGKTLYCNYNKSNFTCCIIFCIILSINSIFLTISYSLSSLSYSNIASCLNLIGFSILIFSQRKFCITEKGLFPISIFKGFLKQDFIPWNTTYSYELNNSTINRYFAIYYIKNNKKEKIGSYLSQKDFKIIEPLILNLYSKNTN